MKQRYHSYTLCLEGKADRSKFKHFVILFCTRNRVIFLCAGNNISIQNKIISGIFMNHIQSKFGKDMYIVQSLLEGHVNSMRLKWKRSNLK